MKWWKWVIIGVLAVGVVGITVLGLKGKSTPPTPVQIAAVKKGSITRTVTGAGKIEAATTVKISSNLSGDLVSRPVEMGDKVQKGQILGRIDRRRYEAVVQQFSSALNAARSDLAPTQIDVDRLTRELARVQELQSKGHASAADLDKATTDLASAKAKEKSQTARIAQADATLEQAKNDLSKTTLTSPIDGTVIEVSREVGERVRGSDFSEDVVMTLAALNLMEVKIEVGEHDVVHLALDQKSTIKIDAFDDQSFPGVVTEIARNALVRNSGTEQETTSFPVKIALSEKPIGVLPGMNAEVAIRAEHRDGVLIIPVQAVTVRPEKTLTALPLLAEGTGVPAAAQSEGYTKVAFVVDASGIVHPRRVTTGIASDTDIEITDGLKEGDRVVSGPFRELAKTLQDGTPVEEADKGKGKLRKTS